MKTNEMNIVITIKLSKSKLKTTMYNVITHQLQGDH